MSSVLAIFVRGERAVGKQWLPTIHGIPPGEKLFRHTHSMGQRLDEPGLIEDFAEHFVRGRNSACPNCQGVVYSSTNYMNGPAWFNPFLELVYSASYMPDEAWRDYPGELSLQQRALLALLHNLIREHVEYIAQQSERMLLDKLAEAILNYDRVRTETIDTLYQKYSELLKVTPLPGMLEFKLSDLEPEQARDIAKSL